MTARLADFRGVLRDACRRVYGERLVSLAVFGSWARGAATPTSDIDILLVAEPLPPSRRKRVAEFEAVETRTRDARLAIWAEYHTPSDLSPVIKTTAEVRAGAPLFLDMTRSCDILCDRDGFLTGYLGGLADRLAELGAQRHTRKGGYFWQYKSGMRPDEVITL